MHVTRAIALAPPPCDCDADELQRHLQARHEKTITKKKKVAIMSESAPPTCDCNAGELHYHLQARHERENAEEKTAREDCQQHRRHKIDRHHLHRGASSLWKTFFF